MPRTFAVVYGFAEGPKIGKKLIRALVHAGLTEAPVEQAAIIIAHSGGCFLLPENIKASKVILIGLSPWSEVSLVGALAKKMYTEPPNMSKFLWNAYYALARPRANWRMYNNRQLIGPENTVIVRNEHDVYFPKNKVYELSKKNYKVVELNGYHDDVWDNPTQYVEIALAQT